MRNFNFQNSNPMKIHEYNAFKFGKYAGKMFLEVLVTDINYLRFLYRKGFSFSANCLHFIIDGFTTETEIKTQVKNASGKVTFHLIKKVICPAAKGKRKKDLVLILENKFIKWVSLEKVPFTVVEKEITSNHFDSKAFQSDDRFFTSTEIRKIKTYNTKILSDLIQSELEIIKKDFKPWM